MSCKKMYKKNQRNEVKSDNWFFNESDRMPAGPIIRLSMLQNGLTLLSSIF